MAKDLPDRLKSCEAYQEYAKGGRSDLKLLEKALIDEFIAFDVELGQVWQQEQSGQIHADEPNNSGCTAIVAVITPTHVIFANAGDSRGVFCSARGGASTAIAKGQAANGGGGGGGGGGALPTVVFGTKDHKPTDPEEAKRIIAANGTVSNRCVLSSFF